ncbi:MAG: hypothetical protein HRU40_10465 [Saprospiraceae bacterium]|nr:hypothetical protein [Saprospiraceae bacterium]
MPRFFLAALGGVVLFLPHLYWQYTHGFPSFRYHLSGRDDAYEIKYTITYVINQLIIFSPFVLPMMLWAVRKGKLPKEEAVMYSWLLIGFWVFFFLMSFKGHVEPQWTVLLSIPLVAWTYSYARQSAAFARWLQRMCYVSIGFLIIARVLLIIPVGELLRDFHKKEWVFALENEVDNGKVVFSNSYRDPSMYYFYSGQRTTQFTDIYYRANQYDLWPWEEDLHGKDITLAGKRNWDCSECLLKNVGGKDFRMKEIKDLQVSQKVDFTFEVKTSTPDSIFIQITLVNPYPFIIVPARGNMALLPGIMFLQNGILQTFEPLHSYPDIWAAEQSLTFTSRIAKPKNLSGTFTLLPGIKTGDLPPAKNSFQPVTFEL